MVLHKHISSGDLYVVEEHVAVVFCCKAVFGSHVSCFYSWKGLESLRVSDRHKESVKSMFFVVDDELSEKGSMSAVNSEVSYPPLGRTD